jgi:hypothetical protein
MTIRSPWSGTAGLTPRMASGRLADLYSAVQQAFTHRLSSAWLKQHCKRLLMHAGTTQ